MFTAQFRALDIDQNSQKKVDTSQYGRNESSVEAEKHHGNAS